jgi:hypothetical protein
LERERRNHGEFFPSLDPDCDTDDAEIHAPFNPNPSFCSSWTERKVFENTNFVLFFFLILKTMLA